MVYIFLYMVNDGESMGNIIGTLFPGWFVDDVFPHIFQVPVTFRHLFWGCYNGGTKCRHGRN